MSTVVVPGSDRSNAFVVVTQVFPSDATEQNGAGPQPTVRSQANAAPVPVVPSSANLTREERAFKKKVLTFLKVHTKALGTVQIMIGILHLLFGIVLLVSASRVLASGVVFWGPVIYLLSGSITIGAANRITLSLLKVSLKMNMLSALTAGLAFGLMMHVTVLTGTGEYGYKKSLFTSQIAGITGVLTLLSLLQFAINICIVTFGCSKLPAPVRANAPTRATRSMGNVYQTTNGQQNLFYVNPSVNLNNPLYSPPSDRLPAYS